MTKQTKQRLHFKPAWPKIAVGSAMAALVAGVYLFHLGNLVPASAAEQTTLQHGGSLGAVLDNPLLLPYKLLAWLMMQLPGDHLLHIRLAAVAIACFSVWLFFNLARRWYGLVAGLGVSALFAASTWTIQTGRSGTGFGVILLTIVGLLNLASWVNNSDDDGRVLVVFAAACGLALFTPGGLWFVLACTALLYRPLQEHRAKASNAQVAAAAGICIAAFAALAVSLLQHTDLIGQWVGLPAILPDIVTLGKQAAFSILYFVIKGPFWPEVWLAHTPLLDAASSAFLLFGIIFYARHLVKSRTRLLLSFVVIGMILVTLNGAAALPYLVPAVYLVAGGGVAYFIHQWNKVFPANPIARVVSVSLLAVLLACIVSFHVQRYFVAWRYSPDTVEAYRAQSQSGTLPPAYHLVQ